MPTVTTLNISSIVQNTASGGGTVVTDGGSAVTVRGVCWSTNPAPTVTNSLTTDGSGTGSFTSLLTGLNSGTVYYVRAYATNIIGTSYGTQVQFTTLPPATLPTVTTAAVTGMTSFSASGGGEVTLDGYSPVIARGVCWSLSSGPTTSDFKTTDGSGTGIFTSSILGLDAETTYHLRAYATNAVGTAYGAEVTFLTLPAPAPECPGLPSITYLGKTYNTVKIGTQCWLKENLNVGTLINGNLQQTDNGILEKYCLNDLETNCSTYGGLYQWSELTAYVTLAGGQGICPQGWHIPSSSEVLALITTEGGTAIAGGKLKEAGTTHWLTPNTGATNKSGFTALPGSFRTISGSFVDPGSEANIWTSSSDISGFSALFLQNNTQTGELSYYANNGMGFSARCLKDTCTSYSSVNVSISPSGNPVCTGTQVNFTATPVNGGLNPFYQWKVNDVKVGINSPAYAFTPNNNDIVTCTMYSGAACAANPATSNTVTMTINQQLPVGISISASANPVCAGTTVIYTATPTNGGTSPAYQWKVNGSTVQGATNATYSFIPVTGNTVECVLTSNQSCISGNPATSNLITMTVNPLLPVSVSISASANPVCAGTSVTFTATPVNGGSSPAYQWKVNGNAVSGATNVTYSFAPADGNTITCVLTSSQACISGSPATSNTLTMTVNPLQPVSVSITASANPVCAGTTVSYTATPVNGGSTPAYQWKLNGADIAGATNAVYSFAPAAGNILSCVLTSSAICTSGNPATSNAITMTVNPILPVSVTVAASANPVCSGTSVTFTATPVNGGTTPAYQWMVNSSTVSGATNSTYSFTPVNGNSVKCTLTSNETCKSGSPATSNIITETVNTLNAVSVTIAASSNPVCSGSSVTYTATPVNGGTTPAYQWKVNGSVVSGATNATYAFTPVSGNTVSCVLTSNIGCPSGNPATSNTITMAVNPVSAVSVAITASANPVCSGTSVMFTATPTNGGTSPAYQWRVNNTTVTGATNATYSFTPVSGNIIDCILTSNIACPTGNPATSNAITMTVNPILPVSLAITASANPSCVGSTVIFTATPTNGGTSPAYQWFLNGNNITGATNAVYSSVPSATDIMSCVLTSSGTCKSGSPATSNSITMSLNSLTTVSVSISASANPVCDGTLVTFTATPVNGGTTPVYQWIVNGANVTGATNATYAFTPTSGNTVKCNMVSSATCPTPNPAVSNTITMAINPQSPVSVSISASSYAVMPSTAVTYTATGVNGGTNPTYQWKKNTVIVTGATNSTYINTAPANNDNIVCVMTSNATACVSNNPATSNTINMIVYSTGTACSPATVDYGGMTYNVVAIGTQCWLRENLNIGTQVAGTATMTNNSVVEKYCYNDDPLNCNVYGGLYQWAELVQYLNGASLTGNWNPVPTGNVQGLCPTGYHIPTNSEVTTFFTFLGGVSNAGGKMKETGIVHWTSPNSSAANTYGFTSISNGYNNAGTFGDLHAYGDLWTSSTGTAITDAYWYGATYNSSSRVTGQSGKFIGYAARCIRDTAAP